MDIKISNINKKGKIKNISKRLIAGVLTFSLVAVPLTGCKEYEKFEYTTNEKGEYVASGKIGYDSLNNYCFLVIENSSYDMIEYYIAAEKQEYKRYEGTSSHYVDVFSNQTIFDDRVEGNRKILICNKIEDYLYATNNIKASYTKEEVEAIFEQLKEDYLKNHKKQKVKE